MKILLRILLISSISIAGASYYAYFTYIPEKIENKVINSFHKLGFTKLSIGEITRDNGKITFSDISLDEKGFSSIGNLSVHFSLTKFLLNPNHAQKIIISDMSLSGEISNGSLILTGQANNSKALQRLKNIPANIVIIKNSSIDILSKELGGVKINYNGQAKISSSGNIEIKAQASSKQKKLSFQSKINGTISSDDLISITAESDQISLSQKDLSIRRGAATIELKHSIRTAQTSIYAQSNFSSINWQNLPLRTVSTTLEITPKKNILTAKGSIFGNENIEWSAQINKTDGATISNINITPARFSELLSFLERNKRLQKNINFPAFVFNLQQPTISINVTADNNKFSGDFKFISSNPEFNINGIFISDKNSDNIKGKIYSKKSYIYAKNKDATTNQRVAFQQASTGNFTVNRLKNIADINWNLNTKIENGHIDYASLKLENINGNFSYKQKNPNKAKTSLNFKMPLKPHIKQSGKIKLNITDKNKPLFQSVLFKIYEGSIKTKTPLFNGSTLSNRNKLIISDINLTQLFHDSQFKDIIIFGKLGGMLPVKMSDGKININGGILQSQGSGIIRLPTDLINGLFIGKSKKMQLIRKALKNYHYEFFEIRLDGDLSGGVMMSINSSGYSPDIKDKESVDISLQIETKPALLFKDLVK